MVEQVPDTCRCSLSSLGDTTENIGGLTEILCGLRDELRALHRLAVPVRSSVDRHTNSACLIGRRVLEARVERKVRRRRLTAVDVLPNPFVQNITS